MATIPENIKAVFDSTYVKIDTIEELEKLVDTPGTQLFKSDNTPITISKETYSDKQRGILGFGKEKDVEKNVYRVSSEPSNTFDISSLLRFGVYRKPILTVLASPTSGSLYLGASEADAMKEQAAVLDADVLKKLAFLRNSKTIFLYAKDVKKKTYSKVSISKDPNTPTTIYLNPMKPTSRAAEEERIKNYLKELIDKLNTDLDSVNGKTDASLEKTCAKLSYEGVCVLSKGELQNNKDNVAKIIQAEIKRQNYNLGDGFNNYIKSALTYGEQIGLDKLKTKYLLVISPKPWVVSAQKAVAPAPAPAPPAAAPEVTQVNVEGKVEPKKEERWETDPRRYLGLGGRRKTKRNDKKSRKGKSKKQAKSRKLFKGFMY
jgi:hypothetical protein